MSLVSQVASLFLSRIQTDNIRQSSLPLATVAPVAAVSDGAAAALAFAAWVQVVAAAVATDPSWLTGLHLFTGVVETMNGVQQVGVGAAASEVARAEFGIVSGVPTAVGVSIMQATTLMYPIRITGTPRFAIRLSKSTGASAAGQSARLVVATGVGT